MFTSVLGHLTQFLSLVSKADRFFRHHRPDAVVLIDYPGFNWWMARRAHFHRIPVFYFVPPQIWAWASWRVKKMRRFVDHVLCTLPFEKEWYAERNVQAEYVGHPFFDELPRQKLDEAFMAEQRARGGDIVALLPGSRNQEVKMNFASLFRTAARIHQERPGTRFLVASFKPHQEAMAKDYIRAHAPLPIETHVGRTPEILELAKATATVSGSVSLELLWRRKPSVIVYRLRPLDLRLGRLFMKVPYISLVNLLAKRELFPEFLCDRCPSEEMARHILTWLDDAEAYRTRRDGLDALCNEVAVPGACERTADCILDTLRRSLRRAA
jgi:lipid-A-disaccharide synthase